MGFRARCGVGLALAVGMLAGATAVQAFDQTAVVEYVQDTGTYIHGLDDAIPAARKAADGLITHVRRDCHGHVPEDPKEQGGTVGFELELEAVFELELAELKPISRPTSSYLITIAQLPWDNTKVTGGFAALARDEAALGAAKKGPDICATVRGAVSSGFSRLPASAGRFAKRFGALVAAESRDARADQGPSKQVTAQLLRYMTPALQKELSRLDSAEGRAGEKLTQLINSTTAALTQTLGAAPYP